MRVMKSIFLIFVCVLWGLLLWGADDQNRDISRPWVYVVSTDPASLSTTPLPAGEARGALMTIPPQNVRAEMTPTGQIRISWDPLSATTGQIKVYHSAVPAAPSSPAWTLIDQLAVSSTQYDLAAGTSGFVYLTYDSAPDITGEFAFVQGGTVAGLTVNSFYMSRYETTWGAWNVVINGGSDDSNLPITSRWWFHAIVYCNWRSIQEGLNPCYYYFDDSTSYGFYPSNWPVGWEDYGYGDNNIGWIEEANGYRLPTGPEWEYAARGGVYTHGYAYSGGPYEMLHEICWFMENSDDHTHPVGTKAPNELGIYDMSGNVREWTWDSPYLHCQNLRGGSFTSAWDELFVTSTVGWLPSFYDRTSGFRICRNAP